MKKTLIIIPAFNEESGILQTCKDVAHFCTQHKSFDYLVINDGSSDSTESILLKNNIPHIALVKNLGIGGAMQTGYKYALANKYDYAIQFDGDNQHDVDFIETVLAPIKEKRANLTIGSRFVSHREQNFRSSLSRRIGIKIISFVIKLKTHTRIYDTTSGFRAADKKVIKLFSEYYPAEYPEPVSSVEALLNGFTIQEVSVQMKPRTTGKSSIHSYKNLYYMFNVILLIIVLRKNK